MRLLVLGVLPGVGSDDQRHRNPAGLLAGLTLTAEVTRPAAEALALAPGRAVWAAVKATAIGVYS